MSYTINNVSVVPPVGSVVSYTGATPPNGWLLCDGTAYSRTTYSALFGVIGTAYGVGNGTTMFNVPNFQAAFLRGAGSQTYPTGVEGTTYGSNARTINTAEGTALQTHGHSVTNSAHNHTFGSINTTHTHSVNETPHTHYYYSANTVLFTKGSSANNNSMQFYNDGNYKDKNCFFSSADTQLMQTSKIGMTVDNQNTDITSIGISNSNVTVSNSTTNANAYETIPFNYAINWIIKY